MNKLFVAPLLPLLLTSCANLYDIGEKGDFFDNNGIPFYIKKGKNTQVTIRERIWLEVRITRVDVDAAGNPKKGAIPDQASLHIVRSSYDSVGLNYIIQNHSKSADGKARPFNEVIEDIKKELDYCSREGFEENKPKKSNLKISESDLFEQLSYKAKDSYCLQENIVSNKQEFKEYIDYDNPYYNANMPWFGSSEGTIELTDSGTLKTSTAKADNSKTADAIPLREYLAKRWGVSSLLKFSPKTATEKYSVSEVVKAHSYTLKKVLSKNVNLGEPIKFNEKNIEVITASFAAQAPGKAKVKKEEKNKIKFDGAIVLPD